MKQIKKLHISVVELVVYSLCLLVALGGLVEMILGAISLNVPLSSPLSIANTNFKAIFGLDLLWWGLILLGIATIVSVFTLLSNAKVSDREFEKAQRRALRLNKTEEVKAPVVDAEVKKVEE